MHCNMIKPHPNKSRRELVVVFMVVIFMSIHNDQSNACHNLFDIKLIIGLNTDTFDTMG